MRKSVGKMLHCQKHRSEELFGLPHQLMTSRMRSQLHEALRGNERLVVLLSIPLRPNDEDRSVCGWNEKTILLVISQRCLGWTDNLLRMMLLVFKVSQLHIGQRLHT